MCTLMPRCIGQRVVRTTRVQPTPRTGPYGVRLLRRLFAIGVSCGGLVTIHSKTKEITRSGQYWAFAHFSRTIRRNAAPFESEGTPAKVDHVACENPDGQKALIVTNGGLARSLTLRLGGMAAEVALEGDSLTTLVWK